MNKHNSSTKSGLRIVICDFDDIQNPLLAAGQAYATMEVGKRLVKSGYDVTVISSRYPGSIDRVENGMQYVHIGLGSQSVQLNNLVYILTLPFSIMRQQADIIVDCFTAPISTLCSQLFTKIPVVGLPTCFQAEAFSKKYHLPLWIIEKFGARTYRYFMPYTEYYKSKMQRLNQNVVQTIIPEGVGEEFFQIVKRSPKHILFLGRIDFDQKGIDLLLNAWEKINHKMNLPLVIAGKGNDEKMLKDWISQKNLSNSVHFVGPAYGDVKKKLLADAQFVVFPSRHEGFSLFSLEALASGNPLVCFDIPSISWAKTNAVYKAVPFDVDDFAEGILSMHKTTSKLVELAKTTARPFTWDSVATKWESFFERIHKGEI